MFAKSKMLFIILIVKRKDNIMEGIEELRFFLSVFVLKNVDEMITSYIHSKSRPQLLEYLGGGFQTVGYKFSDIPCPNSGNYVNF